MNTFDKGAPPVFTKQQVQNMQEDELRKTGLLPLLREMDFRDVYEYHGGSEEKGKDIVCWHEHVLGNRKNLALVVKAKAVSGKASVDKSTAGEIAIQINQCFSKSYIDPITGEDRHVHECWVVSNKPLSKVAIEAITGGLGKSVATENIEFIEIDKLWELIQRYLPFLAALQKVEEVQEEFEQWDSHYRIDAHMTGTGIQFSIAEKFPGEAKEKPIELSPVFSFTDSSESQQYQEALQQLFDKGIPVTIPSTYIQSLGFSDFLQQILPPLTNNGFLQLGSVPPQQPLLLRYEMICDDGEQLVLEYLHMKCVRAGKKEVTLTNQDQPIPIKIQMVIRFDSSISHFHIALAHETPLNIHQVLVQMRFLRCLSKPHTIRLTNIETGILIVTSRNERGLCDAPGEHFMEVLAALETLQMKTGKIIVLPDREITEEEIQGLEMLRAMFLTGKLRATWENCRLVIKVTPSNRKEIHQQLQQFEGGKAGTIFFSEEEAISLFGEQYPLGRFEPVPLEAILVNEQEVKTFLEQEQEDALPLQFVAANEGIFFKEFSNWISKG